MTVLRQSVRRDLEALLNARRRWRSWPRRYRPSWRTRRSATASPTSPPARSTTPRRREELRAEIEDTIRRFEPRFLSVRVHPDRRHEDRLESTLRLRIDAVLHAEPAPEPIAFDTLVDPTTAEVQITPNSADRPSSDVRHAAALLRSRTQRDQPPRRRVRRRPTRRSPAGCACRRTRSTTRMSRACWKASPFSPRACTTGWTTSSPN